MLKNQFDAEQFPLSDPEILVVKEEYEMDKQMEAHAAEVILNENEMFHESDTFQENSGFHESDCESLKSVATLQTETPKSLKIKLRDLYLEHRPQRKLIEDLLYILKSENLDVPLSLEGLLGNSDIERRLTKLEDKIVSLDTKLDRLLSQQSRMFPLLNRSSQSAITQQMTFPVSSVAELQEAEEKIANDPDTFVMVLNKVLHPGGIVKNFHKILDVDLLTEYNYEGTNGKNSFREFKALNAAMFDAVKEEGYTDKDFIAEIRHGFRKQKNKIFKKRYDEKHKNKTFEPKTNDKFEHRKYPQFVKKIRQTESTNINTL